LESDVRNKFQLAPNHAVWRWLVVRQPEAQSTVPALPAKLTSIEIVRWKKLIGSCQLGNVFWQWRGN